MLSNLSVARSSVVVRTHTAKKSLVRGFVPKLGSVWKRCDGSEFGLKSSQSPVCFRTIDPLAVGHEKEERRKDDYENEQPNSNQNSQQDSSVLGRLISGDGFGHGHFRI